VTGDSREVLVHIGAGIGNVVLATPLLAALHEMQFTTDVWLSGDYTQTAGLLKGWSVVRTVSTEPCLDLRSRPYNHILPAIPPFYWARYASKYSTRLPLVNRPSESLFYQNEQEFYLSFARRLGYPPHCRPFIRLPIATSRLSEIGLNTLVMAPGSKTGEMSTKRWPHYSELADQFEDVAVVGTADDLWSYDGKPLRFSSHVKTFVDRLSLRETAELLASAGAVVANDTGLAYIAAAVGTPTLILFGPTPHLTLGRLPPNVRVLRSGLICEPCWSDLRFYKCAGRIDCLRRLSVSSVLEEALDLLGCRKKSFQLPDGRCGPDWNIAE
jgi:ADP-heptose:LPS heptosyltransferase